MSGTVSIKKGSESGLLGAVANVGPVAVAVDGSSNAFRVSLTQIHPMLYQWWVYLPLVLFQWRVRLFKMLQQQAQPCHGGHWVWHLQWQELLAGQEQVSELMGLGLC